MKFTSRVDPELGLNDIQMEVFERYKKGETFTKIANDLGLRRHTLSEWKKTKAWRDADQRRTQEKIDATWQKLYGYCDDAIEVVGKTIKGKASKTQFLASESVLDRCLGKAPTSIEIEDKTAYDLHKRAEELAAQKAEQAEENADESADS